MAQFVERYYNNAPLVAHDIGYTGYLSNCQILDIAGLASHSVSAARRQGTFDSQWVGEAAREIGARIAISYEKPILPEAWEKVACWDTGAVRVAGDDKMCFYAVAPGTRDQLLSNLREFEDQLPPRVSVEYFDQ
jgi:hypothetical protein